MDVAREVASASISMPVKAAWNSTLTSAIEPDVVEGLGVGCRSWAQLVDIGVFLLRGYVDSESQPSIAGSAGERESRLTWDIPPRLGRDFALRLSKSSPQCDNLDFLLGGSECLDTRLWAPLLFFESEEGLPDRMAARFFGRFAPGLPVAGSLLFFFAFLSELDLPTVSREEWGDS